MHGVGLRAKKVKPAFDVVACPALEFFKRLSKIVLGGVGVPSDKHDGIAVLDRRADGDYAMILVYT